VGGIVAITNPNAKKNRRAPDRKQRLEEALGDAGVVFETPMPDDLTPLMEKVLEIDPEIIAVCGGDGTLHLTLTALIRAYGGAFPPKFVILRGGTMNGTATACGVFLPAEMMLKKVAGKFVKGEPFVEVERKTVKLNDWYGFLFGMGAAANFIDIYLNEGTLDGRARAAQVTLQIIAAVFNRKSKFAQRAFKKLEAEVVVDDEPLPLKEYLAVLGGTLRYLTAGLRTLYRAYESNEHFHLIATNISVLTALKNIRRVYIGRPLKADPNLHFDMLARKLEVTPCEPSPLLIDGELYRIENLLVTLGPRIKIITG